MKTLISFSWIFSHERGRTFLIHHKHLSTLSNSTDQRVEVQDLHVFHHHHPGKHMSRPLKSDLGWNSRSLSYRASLSWVAPVCNSIIPITGPVIGTNLFVEEMINVWVGVVAAGEECPSVCSCSKWFTEGPLDCPITWLRTCCRPPGFRPGEVADDVHFIACPSRYLLSQTGSVNGDQPWPASR